MRTHNRIAWVLWCFAGAAALGITVLVTVLAVKHFLPQEEPDIPPEQVRELVCLQFSSYSGEYVEDGTNEKVQDVAAILVENAGTEFLDRAQVTYLVGDELARFVVTGLPPGKRAWVLEADRMVLEEGDTFQLRDTDTAFRTDAITEPEGLTVSAEGNVLTVTNDTGEPMKNLCLYYKSRHTDGYYLGGITYMLSFDTLAPGQTLSKSSAHFGSLSEIVRYSFQTG